MKIGFDISQTGKAKAGCGFYAENLIRSLSHIDTQNQYSLFSTFGNHFWDQEFTSTCEIDHPNFQQGIKQTSDSRAKKFWENSIEILEKKLGNLDILHSNNFFCPPKFSHTKIVYTLYDLSFLEFPECTTEHNRIACFEGIFKASLNADFIIAISSYTRQHFLNTFPHFPENRIEVAHLASRFLPNEKTIHQPNKLSKLRSGKFWLHVGTIEPRKNITRLLHAYAKLKATESNVFPLVLAGKNGWLEGNINKMISDLGLIDDIYLLGYIDNQELKWLYENCFCFIYPSLFEGFGLPVLEAMSFGAPVITSNVSALPEVVGKGGLLIDPKEEEEIFNAMLEMMKSDRLREALKTLALQRSSSFSWKHTAQTVLNIYNKLLKMPMRNKLNQKNTNFLASTT